MCGITGYWAQGCDPRRWRADVDRAVRTLHRRGPDDRGTWQRPDGAVAFGHTRLSILDLTPLGRQPMVSEDGQWVMVFNGEVYNFRRIKAELEALGHRFKSSGDSEVVLAALRQWGLAAIERFIGMFAIALWQERERRLWLIRDRLGVKPLYYAWDGRAFWFGSELKALRAFRAWRAEIDRDALGEYFQFGYISAPRSIYRQVYKLPPGHWLELREGGQPLTGCYWSALEPREPFTAPERELESELESLCIDAFRHRMVADVPVGVFLSGGLDSSLVAAILTRHAGQDIHTFTVGFADPAFDESRWAKEVAQHLGARHTERVLSPREMVDILPLWADLFDEPFGDASGVPTFLVSRVAREQVKVALSADGGDELFSGYRRYGAMLARARVLAGIPRPARDALSRALGRLPDAALQGWVSRLPGPVRHGARRAVVERLDRLRAVLPEARGPALYDAGMSFWTHAESVRLLGGEVSSRPMLNGYRRSFADHMRCTDLHYYLPDDVLTKVDRTTMAAGLEGREPLLDHRLVEFALRLPLHLRQGPLGTKHLMRRVLYRYVPRSILERPKQGFAVPLGRWMRGELAGLLEGYLAPHRVRDGGVLDPLLVERALVNFREGGPARDRLDVQKVWLLLAFEMWRDRWHTPSATMEPVVSTMAADSTGMGARS